MRISRGSATAFANDKPAFDFFVAKGLTQLSGGRHRRQPRSGVGRRIPRSVQYGGGPGAASRSGRSAAAGTRRRTTTSLAYAKQQGESSDSLNLQLEFIWYELTNVGYGFSQLKATTNVTDATIVVHGQVRDLRHLRVSRSASRTRSRCSNAYGATPRTARRFVSQSWPLASQPPFTLKCGESVAAQDRAQEHRQQDVGQLDASSARRCRAIARASSPAATGSRRTARRRSSGTVAPGANGTFSFAFHGPTGAACVPGTYHEYFGVVQEGVAWFSDNGQGGPPDNQIEALIELVPGPPPPPPAPATDDGGTPPATDDGGTPPATDDGGTVGTDNPDGGTVGTPNGNDGNPQSLPPTVAGCSVAPGQAQGAGLGTLLLLLLCVTVLRRRPDRARGDTTLSREPGEILARVDHIVQVLSGRGLLISRIAGIEQLDDAVC